jgi:PII-like signaling protein
MHGFKGERTLMRIHIGERDRDPRSGRPLYQAIVELLRSREYAGATVFRAIMGYGASAHVRSDRVEVLSLDLPIVVECVETEEKIATILPELDEIRRCQAPRTRAGSWNGGCAGLNEDDSHALGDA